MRDGASFVGGRWSVVGGPSSFVVRRWSFVAGRWSPSPLDWSGAELAQRACPGWNRLAHHPEGTPVTAVGEDTGRPERSIGRPDDQCGVEERPFCRREQLGSIDASTRHLEMEHHRGRDGVPFADIRERLGIHGEGLFVVGVPAGGCERYRVTAEEAAEVMHLAYDPAVLRRGLRWRFRAIPGHVPSQHNGPSSDPFRYGRAVRL